MTRCCDTSGMHRWGCFCHLHSVIANTGNAILYFDVIICRKNNKFILCFYMYLTCQGDGSADPRTNTSSEIVGWLIPLDVWNSASDSWAPENKPPNRKQILHFFSNRYCIISFKCCDWLFFASSRLCYHFTMSECGLNPSLLRIILICVC